MITPEQFMAQPADPEEELEPAAAAEPLESIADSLRTIASSLEKPAINTVLRETYDEARAESIEMEEAWERATERAVLAERRLDEVLEVCKPSTSKLANAIRAVIEPPAAPTETPEPEGVVPVENAIEMGAPPPAADADVEEWRAYARGLGYQGPDIDVANRSQIRTMLGIAQPVPAGGQ